MLLMTDFASQGRSSPLRVFSVAGFSSNPPNRVPLVNRMRRASTEYMMLGPVWITMRMAEILLYNLHKLVATRALLLCDIPATLRWDRTSNSSYSLSGRWSRRIKLGLVGLVVFADRSCPRGLHRFEVCIRLFRSDDALGLARIRSAIRLPSPPAGDSEHALVVASLLSADPSRNPFVFDGCVFGRTLERILCFEDVVVGDLVTAEVYLCEFMGGSGRTAGFELLQLTIIGHAE